MNEMNDEIKHIPLNDIEVISNTRSEFNENGLKELSLSIKSNGVIQAIVVKPLPSGKYRLICGERRFRASLLAGRSDIPARILDIPDSKILQFQIVENLQRRSVSTMDEIRAIIRLRDEEMMTHQEIAKAIGKALSHVEAQIKISKTDPEAFQALEKNQIIRQVALQISTLDSPSRQRQAVSALKRDKTAYLVKARDAENWINKTFGVQGKKPSFGNPKPKGRYAADWKYYLVRFSAEQFERFKEKCRNRTDTEVLADAVESVMTAEKEVMNG